jgi:hypothetical protein
VQFTRGAEFSTHSLPAVFTAEPDFTLARAPAALKPGSTWPPGWTIRSAKPDNGEDPAFRYLTKVDGSPPDT